MDLSNYSKSKNVKRIISVSRRTDIPAFYSDWFIKRLKDGFVGYVNPFGGQKYIVSIKRENVICFVFWSKNFNPFIEKLKIVENMGYDFYFNFTVTGLQDMFETNVVNTETAINTMKLLSKMYSPKHINWRYDPIIISDISDYEYHIKNFEKIAASVSGYVNRCYFSYAIQYGKVKKNYDKFQKERNTKIYEPNENFKIKLANSLADISEKYGISLFTCCADYLINEKIYKAHCIDGEVIEELGFYENLVLETKPTRKECGCTESVDIGTYDTCPHGCIYCYANINKGIASNRYENHDTNSVFLGYNKEMSDKWLEEIKIKKQEKVKQDLLKKKQLRLFD